MDDAVAAIGRGEPVILPTDTVYGLVTTALRGEAVRRLYALKGRDEVQPCALLAPSVDLLLELVPELRGQSEAIARALLPGPVTLVLPNPAGRFPWLAGANPKTIGVRVPELAGDAADVLARVTALGATSANLHGGPDPRRLDDVPEALRDAASVVLDGGELPGVPSTVIDFTGEDPRVLREGALPGAAAVERVRAALA
jgi:L-threonylcarbamoyladenylate synthase